MCFTVIQHTLPTHTIISHVDFPHSGYSNVFLQKELEFKSDLWTQ